ncbi:tRNA 5-methoxyuridine(34)/uridine 5-oxyacetic acid(34) synthase CmoB [Candidatus Endoriftia persephone]|jgi:tRNA (mo5U34)-methyltransferase|uniref:tRNA U34 carboxymethyltransferase n=3 Tax=Gammaproteobacteria TaxID=1236 RepID=G2FBI7_9GAMM|nr:tRNA 5-methoxyuridine(34)/uridine 5-oxyacetic acid(34) synthase CmoB [Candidatus Endoriftia persephone]EGW55668.1 tRNA (mo5U34)-methyltransferase [endosymbiont of Tevnia jerichonana (vent Tica)]USF86340.1 tRNA 5-methoxyuridine(34)/uridine 5-oxyacetic acid(34) synthase CmoB [Candidatus Endoriftia persephone]
MRHDWAWIEPLLETPLGRWLAQLPEQVEAVWRERSHGDMGRWQQAIAELPDLKLSGCELDRAAVTAGRPEDCDAASRAQIEPLLQQLHPWRKGPFEICGLPINTEWRSDWKWDRLKDQIEPLAGRLVLDVGCGNGYHCWRMAGAGARQVIGIDPTQLFVMQFEAMRHFLGRSYPVEVLPLGIEDLPANLQGFDTVFSMGVLYHRRSPFEHLSELKGALRKDGQLVLETLVIEGGAGEVLVPEGRYAKMRNVWFIPSPATLESWLRRVGFRQIRTLDVSPTTTEEQRATGWMRFESLADYLDPADSTRTVEGLPAPRRAVILALA